MPNKHTTWIAAIAVVALLGLGFLATGPACADDDVQESELIAVLTSETSPAADKAITCKRLAVYGSKDAVPALAALLPNAQLASWARIALEAIPGEEADQALRDALPSLNGRLAIGVINSIGFRADAKAVDVLAGRLKDADPEVASAAAVALGQIGSAQATAILEQALTSAPAAVRSAVAEGCVLCAEKLLAEDKAAEAASLYDKIRQADVPKQRVIEATRGAILARKSAGVPLLVEQLQSADKAMVAIGLSTASELPGREVTEALVAALAKATPARRVQLVVALTNRNDPAALPAMIEAAKAGPNNARLAAIGMLQRAGNASCIPVLLDVAIEDDAELAQAAQTALGALPGKDVDAELATRLTQANGDVRRLLIDMVGQRRIAAAVDTLLKAVDDPDAQIRSAALRALGSTIEANNLSILITRVVAPQNAEDVPAAGQALRAACIRMPDREACAAQLVAAMAKAPLPAKCTILEILGAMEGSEALQALHTAAKDASPKLQDAATRLLGGWMTVDAAPVLLDLAKNAPEGKYQVRAMRGYIRLVRQFVVPDPQRFEMCQAAMATAQRDAEKKLVLEVMARYPSIDMLRLAVETAKVPSLKDNAVQSALAIAQKIGPKSDEAKKLLAEIGQKTVNVEIIKAEYGAGNKFKDVTNVLRQHVGFVPIITLPKSSYNANFGGDPVPNTPKQLKIQYKIDGKAGEVTLGENAPIVLPMPK